VVVERVRVFVDEAVLGNFPPVCVKDGVRTTDRLTVTQPIGAGPLSWAWLLVFLGPVGWILLLVLAAVARGGGEVLTVELPWSETVYRRAVHARRYRRTGALATVVLATVALVVHSHPAPASGLLVFCLVALATAALAVTVVATVRLARERVTVDLDASRRWVTIGRVHPAFAQAVQPHVDRPIPAGSLSDSR
jgi:hypothetical protein